MADNVTIPASGTGDATPKVATDQLGTGEHVQFVKLMDGTLDSTTKVGASANGLKVDGSAVTQPVSAASLPLPTNAATSARQAAPGTAGTASADVTTVQGIAGMTAVKVDGSAVTQPVSLAAAVTVQQGTGTNLHMVVDSGTVSTITNVVHVDDNAGSLTVDSPGLPTALGQSTMANGMRVTLASDQSAIPVTDNSGSLTVDAPVGTPVAARLSDGAAFLSTSGGRLSVDASGVAVPVTDNAGSLTVDSTQLPGALGANGGLKIEGIAAGQAVPVSGTVALAGTVSLAQAITYNGSSTLLTFDPAVRNTLNEILFVLKDIRSALVPEGEAGGFDVD